MRLQAIETEYADHQPLLQLATSLGAASIHPVSRALAGLVGHSKMLELSDVRKRQGLGVVGISEVQAQALPEDKLKRVLREIDSGFRPLVVGDGINDSLALKAGVVGLPWAQAEQTLHWPPQTSC